MPLNQSKIVSWDHQAERDGNDWVLPDGCCDVIVIRDNDEISDVFVTALDVTPRLVLVRAGQFFEGFRLRPGTQIDPDVLPELVRNPSSIGEQLSEACDINTELPDVIEALSATHGGVRRIAREVGVSERTMQRHFARLGLPAPDFWRLLGRARRAALTLEKSRPLSDIAADCGYSDQAHMTREFVRWFGLAPSRLIRDAARMAQLAQAGLGNWSADR